MRSSIHPAASHPMSTVLPLKQRLTLLALLPVVLLAGCAQTPTAPHVAVMPAPGKPFEQFAAEEKECRAYAQDSIGGENAADRANGRAVGAAALGTVIGAAAGNVLIGPRRGTGEGAGMGLIMGSAIGSGQSGQATQDLQRRYDIAYEQCMYAKGNQIPGAHPAHPRVVVQQPVYVTPQPVYVTPQPVYVTPAPVYAPAPAPAYPPANYPPPNYPPPPSAN